MSGGHSCFSGCPWFCWNPFLKASQSSIPVGMVLCKGPQPGEGSLHFVRPTSRGRQEHPTPKGTVKGPAPCVIFCPALGPLLEAYRTFQHCQYCPGYCDQMASQIGLCPHRRQPCTRSPTFLILHSQPHWQRKASTKAPNVPQILLPIGQT